MTWKQFVRYRNHKNYNNVLRIVLIGLPIIFIATFLFVIVPSTIEVNEGRIIGKSNYYIVMGINVDEDFAPSIVKKICKPNKGIKVCSGAKYYDFYDESVYNALSDYQNRDLKFKFQIMSNRIGVTYKNIISIDKVPSISY